MQLATKDQGTVWEAQQTGGNGAFVFKVTDRKALTVVLTAARRGYQTSQKTYSSGNDEDVCLRPTSR